MIADSRNVMFIRSVHQKSDTVHDNPKAFERYAAKPIVDISEIKRNFVVDSSIL